MNYVYILSDKTNVTVYTGVTNDLIRRVYEHRTELKKRSFTARYHIHKLVYYEQIDDITDAIKREKQIKSWSRAKKNALVEKMTPERKELYDTLV